MFSQNIVNLRRHVSSQIFINPGSGLPDYKKNITRANIDSLSIRSVGNATQAMHSYLMRQPKDKHASTLSHHPMWSDNIGQDMSTSKHFRRHRLAMWSVAIVQTPMLIAKLLPSLPYVEN